MSVTKINFAFEPSPYCLIPLEEGAAETGTLPYVYPVEADFVKATAFGDEYLIHRHVIETCLSPEAGKRHVEITFHPSSAESSLLMELRASEIYPALESAE